MNIIKSKSLGQVVMPLVRVMADADLSWADREKISASIQACHRQWIEMERERQTMSQQSASGQQYEQPQSPLAQSGPQSSAPFTESATDFSCSNRFQPRGT